MPIHSRLADLFSPPAFRVTATTLAVSAVGGLALTLLKAPAGWLSGGTIAVAALAVAGRPVGVPDRLRNLVFATLGILMGAGVTPQTLARIGDWPQSIAILALTVVLIVVAVVAYFRVVCGWDANSALFAAVPGALSYVMIAAADAGADVRRVAIAQSIRLVILIVALPLLVATTTSHGLAAPPPPQGGLADLAILVVACGLGAVIAHYIHLPGGLMFGAFVVSAGLHVSGLVTGTLPSAVSAFCFVVLGGVIGQRFSGITPRELGATALAGIGGFVIAAVIALIGAFAVTKVSQIPFGAALVAFAPGALEGMTALAFGLGLDPAYVAAHQLLRFLAIAITIPFVARIYTKSTSKKPD